MTTEPSLKTKIISWIKHKLIIIGLLALAFLSWRYTAAKATIAENIVGLFVLILIAFVLFFAWRLGRKKQFKIFSVAKILTTFALFTIFFAISGNFYINNKIKNQELEEKQRIEAEAEQLRQEDEKTKIENERISQAEKKKKEEADCLKDPDCSRSKKVEAEFFNEHEKDAVKTCISAVESTAGAAEFSWGKGAEKSRFDSHTVDAFNGVVTLSGSKLKIKDDGGEMQDVAYECRYEVKTMAASAKIKSK